jgi:hypothetical protein
MAVNDESTQGFPPTLSGKKPLVPPTATSKIK